ncbi:MAG: ACP S-malonyltransferase [Clostridia bacterium]
MNRLAFVFSGQGSQYVGMAKEIAHTHQESRDVFLVASETLGYDMEELVFNGPMEKLTTTEYTQPAILTASYAMLLPLLKDNQRAGYAAGLSLGEYTAHVYAGSLDFRDALRLVRKRGQFMQQEVEPGLGGMSAVIGMEDEDVEDALREARRAGIVACANFNSPGQVVISGEKKALEVAGEILLMKGAKRVIPLAVSAPFHCEMLKGAGKKLAAELERVAFREMQAKVVSNVTGDVIREVGDISGLLVMQVSHAVKWTHGIRNMINYGVDTFVEIGPGKVLSGLIKKINGDVRVLNVEDNQTLEATRKELEGMVL